MLESNSYYFFLVSSSESIHKENAVLVKRESHVVFVDENGVVIEDSSHNDLRTVEFNFLDAKNICCGLCGEIVPYELLMNEHLPTHHPEVLGDNHNMDFDETPNVIWLRDKLSNERKHLESGFRSANSYDLPNFSRPNRILRKVSQYRVNPHEMSLDELDIALKKKMVEKMGRRVPVTLVDKQHARCGLCNAVVSLNRKFEVIHLVRHFNAWHPSAHRCQPQAGLGKPLSMQDFAVIDTAVDNGDNLQCIWCGMFMSVEALAMHFSEVHPDDIEVPKCNLCLKELVINARLFEKYNEDFAVTLPDEHHIRCGKFNTTHTSESQFDKAIERRMRRIQSGGDIYTEDAEEDELDLWRKILPNIIDIDISGRRSKPKRQFIMPALRQAAPVGSRFVEPVTDCHWKCKLCKSDILAAVISAGAIRHYRIVHPELLEEMQYELCKARLERVSDGCMEFVHPQLIECLVCNMTYMLHRPYNICRAIRHLKSKHPDMMPEYAGMKEFEKVKLLAVLHYIFLFVQALEGADGERVYVLMAEGEEIDPETANQLAESIGHIMVEENATEKQAVRKNVFKECCF
ncbi:unnamed protein product [Dracunculus medinensis]|uniref:Uncharacterized protein n=1 Tax=Dracunculus medinensis TaxID=318479 RepID=A0A3P7PY18_DRAME|nr:unnamed protein product [Dracunculus medinensis]